MVEDQVTEEAEVGAMEVVVQGLGTRVGDLVAAVTEDMEEMVEVTTLVTEIKLKCWKSTTDSFEF